MAKKAGVNKPEVGQKVFLLYCGNLARRYKEEKFVPATVTRVGRKYFYVLEDGKPEHCEIKFDLDGWGWARPSVWVGRPSALVLRLAEHKQPASW